MNNFGEILEKIKSPDFLFTALKVVIILGAGLLIVRILTGIVLKIIKRSQTQQVRTVVRKVMIYFGNSIIILTALAQAGAELSAILGAAGVLGIAVGIASQTSLSNIISGLFVVGEKAFQIGDVIKSGEITGVVDSIDLLSVKIKTFDNLFVRIPNTKIISQELTNITRYPLRRMDFNIKVPFNSDLGGIQRILLDIAFKELLCLNNPEPLILFTDFSDSGINVLYGIWFDKSDYVSVRNNVFKSIISSFRKNKIEIAIPHIALFSGSGTKAMPVELKTGSRKKGQD